MDFEVMFLIGACRSGKSSLGSLLGTLPHFFHVEENWLLLMLPAMCRTGLIREPLFINLYRAWINELIYDTLLMRTVSFRPTDQSFIRRTKSEAAIRFSLDQLKNRADVDAYLKSRRVKIVLNLAEVNPFIDLLERVYPSARILHLIRDPRMMTKEVYEKKWFSDESLLAPSNKQLFFKHGYRKKVWYIPFWVSKDQLDRFVEMSEDERAAHYVFRQYALTAEALARAQNPHVSFIAYEDLVTDPPVVLEQILPGFCPGDKTEECMNKLRGRNPLESCGSGFHLDGSEDMTFINRYIPEIKQKYVGTFKSAPQ